MTAAETLEIWRPARPAGGLLPSHAETPGAADPEIRLAAGNRLRDTLYRGPPFPDGDVETSVAVEALLKRLIVAGELKLMLPFELQRHCLERKRPGAMPPAPGEAPTISSLRQGQFSA